jgi:hypothetical protein
MRKLTVGLLFGVIGCMMPVPPGPPTPHAAMDIAAPVAKTWDAVIDVFASKNIPIKTMDRSSGFIATEEMSVPFTPRTESPYADCGKKMGIAQPPTHANYNIRVKGDSTRSSVQVSVFWKDVNPAAGAATQCSSKGIWETEAEQEIKARAEGR